MMNYFLNLHFPIAWWANAFLNSCFSLNNQ